MNKAIEWLQGKKTYATAAAVLVVGILRWQGIEVPEVAWAILAALGLSFIRAGVKKAEGEK